MCHYWRHANQHAQATPSHTLCHHKISAQRSARWIQDAATSSEPNRILPTVKTLQQSRFLSDFRYGNSCSGLARHNTTMRKSWKFKMSEIYPRPDRTSVELTPQTSSKWTNTSNVFTMTTFKVAPLRPRCVAQTDKQSATRSCHRRQTQLLENDQTERTRNSKEWSTITNHKFLNPKNKQTWTFYHIEYRTVILRTAIVILAHIESIPETVSVTKMK